MADREAQLREAERKLNAQIRERTSPSPEETPSLRATLLPRRISLAQAVDELVPLLEALKGQNAFVHDWRVVRSAADHDAASGLDPIAQPKAAADFFDAERKQTDATYRFSILGFSSTIYPEDARRYSAQISYAGGLDSRGHDVLSFQAQSPRGADTLSFDQWAGMVNIITQWRAARYIGIGPASYGPHSAVFEHRAWRGWMGWLAHAIDPARLPAFAIVRQIGEGTLVASQPQNIRADRPDDLARAAEVEVALADLGVLPTNSELR